jgi:hypothetical protein
VNNVNASEQWRDAASHLVEAHGAHSGSLIAHAPTLEQLRFAHADTHVALASADALPPDRHTHPLPLDAGRPDARIATAWMANSGKFLQPTRRSVHILSQLTWRCA